MRRPDRWAAAAAVAVYTAAIAHYARQFTVDKVDGLQAITSGLALFGLSPEKFHVNLTRPPLGWILTAPVVAAAYKAGGPEAALRASHVQMTCLYGAVLFCSYELFSRCFSRSVAALLAALMALNPLCLSFAPFAMYDIFAALAGLPFLWAAWRYVEKPGPRRWALAFGAYALGVFARYQLAALIFVPLAFVPLDRRPMPAALRVKRLLISPFWLLPPLGYGLCILAGGIVDRVAGSPGLWTSIGRMDWAMRFVVSSNFSRQTFQWYFYFASIVRQTGWLAVFAALGAWSWLRRGGNAGLFLFLSLAAPLLFMSFSGSWKEERYVLSQVLLVYAALAEGVSYALKRAAARLPRVPRWALTAGLLALAPWKQTAIAWDVLRREPTVRTRAHWDLARALDRESPAVPCVEWDGEQAVFFDHLELSGEGVDILMLGNQALDFYSRSRFPVVGLGSAECPSSFVVESRRASNGAKSRWEGGPLLKVYEKTGRDGVKKPRWEVFPYELREAAGAGK